MFGGSRTSPYTNGHTVAVTRYMLREPRIPRNSPDLRPFPEPSRESQVLGNLYCHLFQSREDGFEEDYLEQALHHISIAVSRRPHRNSYLKLFGSLDTLLFGQVLGRRVHLAWGDLPPNRGSSVEMVQEHRLRILMNENVFQGFWGRFLHALTHAYLEIVTGAHIECGGEGRLHAKMFYAILCMIHDRINSDGPPLVTFHPMDTHCTNYLLSTWYSNFRYDMDARMLGMHGYGAIVVFDLDVFHGNPFDGMREYGDSGFHDSYADGGFGPGFADDDDLPEFELHGSPGPGNTRLLGTITGTRRSSSSRRHNDSSSTRGHDNISSKHSNQSHGGESFGDRGNESSSRTSGRNNDQSSSRASDHPQSGRSFGDGRTNDNSSSRTGSYSQAETSSARHSSDYSSSRASGRINDYSTSKADSRSEFKFDGGKESSSRANQSTSRQDYARSHGERKDNNSRASQSTTRFPGSSSYKGGFRGSFGGEHFGTDPDGRSRVSKGPGEAGQSKSKHDGGSSHDRSKNNSSRPDQSKFNFGGGHSHEGGTRGSFGGGGHFSTDSDGRSRVGRGPSQVAFDAYKVLGVSRSATQDEIKSAHKKLAMQHHPDRVQDEKTVAGKKMADINRARDILVDPQKKRDYDFFGTL